MQQGRSLLLLFSCLQRATANSASRNAVLFSLHSSLRSVDRNEFFHTRLHLVGQGWPAAALRTCRSFLTRCTPSAGKEQTSHSASSQVRNDILTTQPTSSNQPQCRRQHMKARNLDKVFVYRGPLSQAIRNLKRLSIAGCAASLLGGPILAFGAGEALPLAAQGSIVVTVGAFGIFTTSLLHWFTSPYVHMLEYDNSTGLITARTASIFGRLQSTTFKVAEAAYPNTIRPQVTFQVNGKFFYLDADNFTNKDLLRRLTPVDPNSGGSQEEAQLSDNSREERLVKTRPP